MENNQEDVLKERIFKTQRTLQKFLFFGDSPLVKNKKPQRLLQLQSFMNPVAEWFSPHAAARSLLWD